ncbi:metal ABC transporter permease [Staphylococcus shinii]|jgi:iron/zinc/copper transport system permease protein|uniref:metal ABC transporter permease n=1 Tax=Staphylococcus shinii TaxID=2912228 RepID=UPI000E6A30B2|nr:metal ABC transporter permease [Staphylococcus shinii]MDW8563721.1 metal ABC transporter permease [Staphylococcus shinii]MDW8566961.1 metal ABC transporter permease [Staphylococcus shinii]MDW8569897.1 metal ABC transporter permease [Staphylococcus shinii]MDW8574199.1 metal ABC transporter permease [Staphylococcus shinii]RIN08686.1 metal ABC transporter permease [Staphylococcus shinii]
MVSQFIHDVFEFSFLQRALITSIVIGMICGVIGCFIVLRSLALMGDAISHAVLPGVAISYMIGINFFYGAVVFGVLAALGIGFVNQNSKIKSDSSIGIVFSSFLALGVLLITKAQSAIDLTEILFGNVLTVKPEDRTITFIVVAIVLIVIIVFYKEFLLSSFDPTMAAASGLPVKFIHYTLMVLLTLVTVASLQTVGVILVVSLLITPASTAYLLTKRLSTMILTSALIGMVSSVIGLFFSVTFNLPSGVVIVLVITIIFIITFILAPKNGLLWKVIKS